MAETSKIVYLFGAGATHAEKQIYCRLKKAGLSYNKEPKDGMTGKQISERVIKSLFLDSKGKKILNSYGIIEDSFYNIKNPRGLPASDMELLIWLVESNRTVKAHSDAQLLRKYFKDDICRNLTVQKKTVQPNLFSALLELDDVDKNEQTIGYLSLNYDSMLESAMKNMGREFDFGLDIDTKSLKWPHKSGRKPLLKLHGSFDWNMGTSKDRLEITPTGNPETMQWIPPSLNKDYLNYPYNIIHGKAYEILVRCNVLRIVGCALNQNDANLISLLFRTQHKGPNPYKIEVIGGPSTRDDLVRRLGLYLSFEQSFYENNEFGSSSNPFLDWIYYKSKFIPRSRIKTTNFLKRVENWAKL